MKALKVSELTAYINKVLKMDHILQGVLVEAEISQAKQYASGHLYLTLKDEDSQISAIMYKWAVKNLDFEPKHGMKVLATGQIMCYEQAGKLQMNISSMTIAGQGALHLEFLKRKEILEKEGLFDVDRKKGIPKDIKKIGLVTSLKAAALADFLRISSRRNPNVDIVISPSSVQGDLAPRELITALERLEKREDIDVIVITRGGGSLEDLWAFNDEELVRKIASIDLPIVSAVGHEIDFTLTDFVADLRASTPSAAAELLLEDRDEMIQRLDYLVEGLISSGNYYLQNKRRDLTTLEERLTGLVKSEKFSFEKMGLERMLDSMSFVLTDKINYEKKQLEIARTSLSPNYIKGNARQLRLEVEGIIGQMSNLIRQDIKEQEVALEELLMGLKESSQSLSLHRVYSKSADLLLSIKDLQKDELINIDFYDGTVQAQVKNIIKLKGDQYEL